MERTRHRRKPRLSMAPLIDIVFQLLIFSIFTAGVLSEPQNVAIQLPHAESAESSTISPLFLIVSKGGEVYLDDEEIQIRALQDIIAGANGAEIGNQVFIYADGRVEFDTIMQIMDEVRLAGLENISFAVHEGEFGI